MAHLIYKLDFCSKVILQRLPSLHVNLSCAATSEYSVLQSLLFSRAWECNIWFLKISCYIQETVRTDVWSLALQF